MAPCGTRFRGAASGTGQSIVARPGRRGQNAARVGGRLARRLSLLFLVLDVPDDVGDVLVALLLLLDEGGVVHRLVLELDLLFAALGRLAFVLVGLLALRLRVGLLERNEFGLLCLRRHHLFLRRGRRAGGDRGGRLRTGARADRREL